MTGSTIQQLRMKEFIEIANNKRCSKCGHTKLIGQFSPANSTADGLHTICKSCRRAYMRARVRGKASEDGTVYFILDGWGNIKIGLAKKNLQKRIKAIQATSSVPVTLLATEPGGRKREMELQEYFSYLRIRDDPEILTYGPREWFRPGEELFAYIDDVAWQSERWSMPLSGRYG